MANKINVKKNSVKRVLDNIDDVVLNLNDIKFNYSKGQYTSDMVVGLDNYIYDLNNYFNEIISFEKRVNKREQVMLENLLTKLNKLDIDKSNNKTIINQLKKIKNNPKLSSTQKRKKLKEKYNELIQLIGKNKTKDYFSKIGVNVKVTKNATSLVYLKKKKTATTTIKLKLKSSSNVSNNAKAKNLRSLGVVYYNGHKETWYSQKILPGGGLKIPGRHVASDGTIRDQNNYICVAADPRFLKRGSLVETSLGMAKVYDSGCAYGTIDVYTNW